MYAAPLPSAALCTPHARPAPPPTDAECFPCPRLPRGSAHPPRSFSARDQTHSFPKTGRGLRPLFSLLGPTLQELYIAHCSDIFHAASFKDLPMLPVRHMARLVARSRLVQCHLELRQMLPFTPSGPLLPFPHPLHQAVPCRPAQLQPPAAAVNAISCPLPSTPSP